ncbi:MAG: hypothetical protein Q9225_004753 [Loekoesia sp. 1 TL-2023]
MAKLAKSKTATDDTPVAPKDINGDVTTANELDDASPRPSRKRAGDFFDFEDDEAEVGGTSTKPSAQPKKKSRTTAVADKKTKPSKGDGHPVVTEKTHPGGDMVETEPAEKPKAQKRHESKVGRKDEATRQDLKPAVKRKKPAREGTQVVKGKENSKKEKKDATKPQARINTAASEKGENTGALKTDSGKTDLGVSTKETPSQAEAIEKKSAPKKPRDKKSAEPKAKSKIPNEARGSEPKGDTASAQKKTTASGISTKDKEAGAKDPKSAPAATKKASNEQTMDEAPFKKLLKRERAKIPSVKASADAAEADRKASTTTDATKALGKEQMASKAKGPKPIESSKAEAPKGKKRKDSPETAGTQTEAGPSEKKQKKSRKSALDLASSAVGDLVNTGIEAAARGVSAVKDMASALGNDSIADDVTAVAKGAVDEKSKNENAEKRASLKEQKSNRAKGKGKAERAEPAADEPGFDEPEEDGDAESFEEGDQTLALIKGFESEGDDEPNTNEGFKEGMKMPQIPKSKDLTKKLKAVKEDDAEEEPAVIYVGLTPPSRIPHGFYEPQMRAYFTQFGHILRLRLSRNRTTGASKHYAFIEFASAAVASIVAETMNNYLLFGHILKCRLVPKEQLHENLWKGANKRFKKVPWAKIEGRKLEVGVGKGQWEKRVKAERKRRIKKGDKLKELGYEFEAPKVKGVEDVKGEEKGKQIEEGTVEEKTLVTTDGGDGSMVISEEVKTKKGKKGGKRKADEDKAEGIATEVAKKAKKAKKGAA